jgi:putative acetyltransferase
MPRPPGLWHAARVDVDVPAGLREVRDSDSAGLIALIGACWAAYPGCVMDIDGEEPWLRAPAAGYARMGGRMWVVPAAGAAAAAGTAIDACVGYVPGPGVATLKNLYVAATARRRGLGAALVGLVEQAARDGGFTRVQLWSDTRFAEAHRLYARLGYARGPRTRDLHDLSNTTEYEFSRVLG